MGGSPSELSALYCWCAAPFNRRMHRFAGPTYDRCDTMQVTRALPTMPPESSIYSVIGKSQWWTQWDSKLSPISAQTTKALP